MHSDKVSTQTIKAFLVQYRLLECIDGKIYLMMMTFRFTWNTVITAVTLVLLLTVVAAAKNNGDDDEIAYKNELIEPNDGWTIYQDYVNPLPSSYIQADELPKNFNWGNIDGKSYLTHSLNQHIPQ